MRTTASKRFLVVIAVASLATAMVAVLSPHAAVAEPAASTPATPTGPPEPSDPPMLLPDAADSGNCADVRENLGQLADDGGGFAVCYEFIPPSQEAKSVLQRMGTADVLPLPDHCMNGDLVSWFLTRTGLCQVKTALLTVIDPNTGAVVATMEFLQLSYLFSDTLLENWQFQLEIWPVTVTGVTAGTSVVAFENCSGACNVISSDFPPQPVGVGLNAGGYAQFATTVPASGLIGSSTSTWIYWFQNPAWTAGLSTAIDVIPPVELRCDNVSPEWPGVVGCVFPDYPPRHEVSLSGPNPLLAKHILWAQGFGLPGTGAGGKPVLHRLTDPALRAANRNAACPPSRPRPSGHDCDEYPFASTWEGAATGGGGPGRTYDWCQIADLPLNILDPTGYSACMIPSAQNQDDGSRLARLYRDNRVLDGDGFRVWVVQ